MQGGGSGGVGGSRPSQSSRASQTSQTSQVSGGPRRQSGAPAPGSQPPYDPMGLGLPDLSGYAPRKTPRVAPDQPELPRPEPPSHPSRASQPPALDAPSAAAGQPHTLGVTAKLARLRGTGAPSLPQPHATLTQQMRAVEPPDVARQTLDEQKMRSEEHTSELQS